MIFDFRSRFLKEVLITLWGDYIGQVAKFSSVSTSNVSARSFQSSHLTKIKITRVKINHYKMIQVDGLSSNLKLFLIFDHFLFIYLNSRSETLMAEQTKKDRI